MAIKLFGYKIGKDDVESEQLKSFVTPTDDDAAVSISGGGVYGTYMDLEGQIRSDADLIKKYREMALQPECDAAIEDIVNEALVFENGDYPVQIILDKLQQPESIKKMIRDEFYYVMKLLDFNNQGYDIFRRWYVDGRLYYHMLIDDKNPRAGLKEVRYIDPRKIRKVREDKKQPNNPGIANTVQKYHEYFMYSDKGFSRDGTQGIKIAVDSVCYANSGITDKDGKIIVSHLHKAIKPLNQLRMLEDATVIYRISRAPERRIFYIDVGNLPKMKAEQYLREIMQKYKNKLVYDANTGEIRDDRRYQTMLEDFWLPRREGGKGTEITTLSGGQNLGEIDDVLYFQKKMFKSLNVPVSRLEADTGFSLGRASEITRDELKFGKFVSRLRLRFSILFDKILETQLLLKGVCTRKEWEQMKEEISYDYQSDAHFAELKNTEIMKERLSILSDIDGYVGKYFSVNYIRTNILHQSEDDIKQMDEEMEEDKARMDEEGISPEDLPPPPPPPPPPQQVVVSVKKEETETRIIDDADQRELAKSMTAFFGTLVEEPRVTKKEPNLSGTISEAVSVATSVAYTRQEIQKLKTELVSLLEKKTTEVIVEQVPGPVGPRGSLGATGAQGPKGDKGDTGDVGEKGEVGPQGNMGLDGPRGLKGDKGDKGEQGQVGPQGEQGIQGVIGERGPQGLKGDRGKDGKNGLDGKDGEAGAIGPVGPAGSQGVQGGQGPKGDKGERGRDGQQGIAGPAGPQGEIGPQGIQGVAGKDGKDGDIKPVEEKFQKFIENVQKDVSAFKTKVNAAILKSGPNDAWKATGSGEVNLRYLDDVDRDSITDGYVLSYDQASQKFVFVEQAAGAGGGTVDNTARTRATSAWNTANLAYSQSNSAFSTANASYIQANTATTNASTANNQAASAFSKANTSSDIAQAAYNYANTIVVPSLSGYAVNTNVNLVWSTANNAYGQANSALDLANSAFAKANTGGAAGTDNLARSISNSAFSTANSALSIAQSAFAQANTGGGGGAATDSLNIIFNNHNASSYKVVAIDANSETILASTLDVTQANKVVGVLDANNETVTLGTLTNPSWTWTLDQTLYLGSNGEIVTTSTIDGAQFSLKVGYSLSSTKVFVKIGTPVVL